MTAEQGDASASLWRHLLRGAIGFAALIASLALLPAIGLVSLLFAPIGLVALRGCPLCWAVGLAQTLSRDRLARRCEDGGCELVVAPAAASQQRQTPSGGGSGIGPRR